MRVGWRRRSCASMRLAVMRTSRQVVIDWRGWSKYGARHHVKRARRELRCVVLHRTMQRILCCHMSERPSDRTGSQGVRFELSSQNRSASSTTTQRTTRRPRLDHAGESTGRNAASTPEMPHVLYKADLLRLVRGVRHVERSRPRGADCPRAGKNESPVLSNGAGSPDLPSRSW